MSAVWYRAWIDLRRRVWATVGLALVVALAGGLVLAAIAGASRTRGALPHFFASSRPEHAYVDIDGSPAEEEALGRELAALPGVAAVATSTYALFAGTGDDARPILGVAGGIGAVVPADDDVGHGIYRARVLAGRMPNPAEPREAAVDEDFAEYWDVGAGDGLRAAGYGREQIEVIGNGRRAAPTGPKLELEVTGVFRRPSDLAIDTFNQTGSLFEVNTRSILLTPAFWERHGPDVANYGLSTAVRLERGDAGYPAFERSARTVDRELYIERGADDALVVDATQRSINLQAHALLATGVLFAVVAVALVGQAVVRRLARSADDDAVLVVLGWSRRRLAQAGVVRVAPVALAVPSARER